MTMPNKEYGYFAALLALLLILWLFFVQIGEFVFW